MLLICNSMYPLGVVSALLLDIGGTNAHNKRDIFFV
jgi:hypothetical protein